MQVTASTTFSDLLQEVERFWTPLPDKPEETAERILSALWSTACGAPVSADRALPASLPELDGESLGRLLGLIERKKAGVPLAHLTERQTFLGIDLLASREALIPRKETEILGRAALVKIGCMAKKRGPLLVVDVCTGSGNLASAYAYYEPQARVCASDLSPEAIELAKRNVEFLGLAKRVELRVGDLLEPFESPEFVGRCDLLSCNPPYISTAKVKQMHPEISQHEPQAAFNGGAFGVSILMKLVKNAPRFLRPGGWLGFEVGHGQGAGLARQLERNPAFAAVETYSDPGGEIRAILAKSRPVLP
ncbi:MAG: peptide chain release factor N(5)-glutamine methyltransferase [Betaproteobacteria bacterium]|nr:peptide chain release factor N(5)-glutamine methyltransferase [Betaproteobacteria bacterium]MBV9361050.1 peptide chain release factor N(5)-glutamine methyltransferase [Betaproteobacteria bacterium]